MKINLGIVPGPLVFGSGEAEFSLHVRAATELERMAVVDAIASARLVEVQEAVSRLVIGWQGVLDLAGNPIPFESMDVTGRNRVSNLGVFLGLVPAAVQARVIAAIIGFLGIPSDRFEQLAQALTPEPIPADPTTRPGGAMPPSGSGGS